MSAVELTPREGVTLYPGDEITITLVHTHWLPRLLRLPEAKLRLAIDTDGRLHVHEVAEAEL